MLIQYRLSMYKGQKVVSTFLLIKISQHQLSADLSSPDEIDQRCCLADLLLLPCCCLILCLCGNFSRADLLEDHQATKIHSCLRLHGPICYSALISFFDTRKRNENESLIQMSTLTNIMQEMTYSPCFWIKIKMVAVLWRVLSIHVRLR